ncbi:MAG: HAMP domain-containing methyl-accepting chemotaxis protein [Pseudomonadota bacterium]
MLKSNTIAFKLIVSIGSVVLLGFSTLLVEQWLALNSGLHALATKDRIAVSDLLAQNVSGGLRWKKHEIIEKSYSKLVSDTGTDVATLVTADVEGNTVTSFSHEQLPEFEITNISEQWQKSISETGAMVEEYDSHTVVVSEVVSAKNGKPVGYLAIAFSNQALNGFALTETITAAIISLTGIAVVFAVIFVAVRVLFSKPMESLTEIASELANGDGDLTRRLDLNSKDELGNLSDNINSFIEKIQGVMGNVVCSVDSVGESVDLARNNATQNQTLLDQQTSRLKDTNDALQKISDKLEGMVGSTQELASSTQNANSVADSANATASRAVTAVSGLTEKVLQTETVIRDLDDRSQNIGSVLDVIKGIAEQTNLLALNAAIEAARAGEQGRGFAVVADEVRTLASRTQQSTEEIQEIIESLQSGAQQAVASMGAGRAEVSDSAELINNVKDSLTEIATIVKSIADTNASVASEVGEQSATAKNAAANIDSISSLSETILENGNSTADSCQHLVSLSSDLNKHVAFFKV